jgi:hypothetical protein
MKTWRSFMPKLHQRGHENALLQLKLALKNRKVEEHYDDFEVAPPGKSKVSPRTHIRLEAVTLQIVPAASEKELEHETLCTI